MKINEKVDALLNEYWKCPEVWKEKEAVQPFIILPTNTSVALSILNKHIRNKSNVLIHTDVDMDGFGTNYILRKFLYLQGLTSLNFCVNKDKVHGILPKHVAYVNKPGSGIDLVIITDSSSNEIETIKKFKCDVIVIDHHNMEEPIFNGMCDDGEHRFVIVNNTIDNLSHNVDSSWLYTMCGSTLALTVKPFEADPDMSCGVLMYELLRVYQIAFNTSDILQDNQLAQWAAVTLFTDAIDLRTPRNQWYISQLVDNSSCETTLKRLMELINPYKTKPSKTAVNYSIAPQFNKAIRANAGSQALEILFYKPQDVLQLSVYSKQQEEAVSTAMRFMVDKLIDSITKKKGYVIFDMTDMGINKTYAGVIASKISGEYYVNCVVFIRTEEGTCKGSFRGRIKRVKYIDEFTKLGEDVFAQGHDEAFGFECTYEQLESVMKHLSDVEVARDEKWGISLGDMPESEKLKYHFNNWEELRYYGGLILIATGNARINSDMELHFKVSANNVRFIEEHGKVFNYDVMGVNCKSFSRLTGSYFNVYAEYTSEINFYIKAIGGIFK